MKGTTNTSYNTLLNALYALIAGRARVVKVIDPDPYEGGVFTIRKRGRELLLLSPTGDLLEHTSYLEPILFFFSPAFISGGVTVEVEA